MKWNNLKKEFTMFWNINAEKMWAPTTISKKLLLNIFLVTIFAISSLFVWYYFSPQNQHLPEGKIAQNIKTPTSQTITKKPPTPTDKSPAQRYTVLKAGEYNVNIGSFKEKKTNPWFGQNITLYHKTLFFLPVAEPPSDKF